MHFCCFQKRQVQEKHEGLRKTRLALRWSISITSMIPPPATCPAIDHSKHFGAAETFVIYIKLFIISSPFRWTWWRDRGRKGMHVALSPPSKMCPCGECGTEVSLFMFSVETICWHIHKAFWIFVSIAIYAELSLVVTVAFLKMQVQNFVVQRLCRNKCFQLKTLR